MQAESFAPAFFQVERQALLSEYREANRRYRDDVRDFTALSFACIRGFRCGGTLELEVLLKVMRRCERSLAACIDLRRMLAHWRPYLGSIDLADYQRLRETARQAAEVLFMELSLSQANIRQDAARASSPIAIRKPSVAARDKAGSLAVAAFTALNLQSRARK
jgi:hypothetical protein